MCRGQIIFLHKNLDHDRNKIYLKTFTTIARLKFTRCPPRIAALVNRSNSTIELSQGKRLRFRNKYEMHK
jgi:hypothetical protein